jgi:hypothetical protein
LTGKLTRMKKLLVVAAIVIATSVAAAGRANVAEAWCWPSCSGYGVLTQTTSTYNGCWYSLGEVCSGWNYWTLNGIDKKCWPVCEYYYTHALVLYGFENSNTIRGRFTDSASTFWIAPRDVSMGGYLRAQINWWPYSDGRMSYSSLLNAAAV